MNKVVLLVLGGLVLVLSLWLLIRHYCVNRHVESTEFLTTEEMPDMEDNKSKHEDENFTQAENVDKRYFPWEDVESCITEKAIELESMCPQCGHPKKKIYFKSPEWTWEDLCGCKGILTICEHCKIQFDFRCTGMN